jgi:zinc transporter 1/2/3
LGTLGSWYSLLADDVSLFPATAAHEALSNFLVFPSPIGVAAGYGARQSYNDNSATKNAVSGILDAFSAGILLYTGLVELLGHEILLNPRTMKASSGKLTYIFLCMLLGSGLMALLARWA